MNPNQYRKTFKIFLTGSFVIFIFFLFYDLNWGAPFYFHPDERNIASSVSQLNFPKNLNPHFYAYGSFPIYSIYLVGLVVNVLSKSPNILNVNFYDAILISRYFSATLSVLSVFMIYKISKELGGKNAGIISSFLAITSAAFLQFSHIGTFEMWISFLSLLLFYVFHVYIKTGREKFFLLAAFIFGILSAVKISLATLFPVFIFVLFLSRTSLLQSLRLSFVFFFFSSLSYFFSSPYNLLDFEAFFQSIKYEGNVATGALEVFYTGSFANSIPFVFHYTKILPFLINPILTIISVPALIYSLRLVMKEKNKEISLLVIFLVLLFIPQALLFVKWTRYIIPSIPFLLIIVSIYIVHLSKILPKKTYGFFVFIVFIFSLLFSFSFLKTVRFSTDSRIEALGFARKNIPQNSRILSEAYDLGITPFNKDFGEIDLFNFYDLDSDPEKSSAIYNTLENYDYLILPSQRILKSRLQNKNNFPKGSEFYNKLMNGNLGFEKIYQTNCDSFCKILYIGNPILNVEETASVFDRPTVFIFKKIKH